ncbi:hypothetical protein V1477_007994 [Vespula maculifrons]|uniref:Uncharacterized protein n=1 Tax=Vespula maculifrons TaxID=7453 RepID=A0ABD2CF91_VESMC
MKDSPLIVRSRLWGGLIMPSLRYPLDICLYYYYTERKRECLYHLLADVYKANLITISNFHIEKES